MTKAMAAATMVMVVEASPTSAEASSPMTMVVKDKEWMSPAESGD